MINVFYCFLGISTAFLIELQLIVYNIALLISTDGVIEDVVAFFIIVDTVLILLHIICGIVVGIRGRRKKELNPVISSTARFAVRFYEEKVCWVQTIYFWGFSTFLPGVKENPLYHKIASGIFISGIIGTILYVNELILCRIK